jgi:hypothetical protein
VKARNGNALNAEKEAISKGGALLNRLPELKVQWKSLTPL